MKKKHAELTALTLREKNLEEHFSVFLSNDWLKQSKSKNLS